MCVFTFSIDAAHGPECAYRSFTQGGKHVVQVNLAATGDRADELDVLCQREGRTVRRADGGHRRK